jgi:two-component system, NtrC family, sensor histidine kinase KinB
MKVSIRTRLFLAMILLFIIILVLSVFSGYHLNKLSNKTSAILKENYLSVVYAREMSEGIMIINQEIASSFLLKKNPDSLKIVKELGFIDNSLISEKNNITAPGEDKLVSGFETDYSEYRDTVIKLLNLPQSSENVLYLQNKSGGLYKQMVLLSQMNGKSIENKTEDAKVYAKKAFLQMSVLGTLCFLIALSFLYSLTTYFNERFFQLHHGITELVSTNYSQRLYFDGEDEFSEIARVFNEMAKKLSESIQNKPVTIKMDSEKGIISHDVQELKEILERMHIIENQVSGLISKFKTE